MNACSVGPSPFPIAENMRLTHTIVLLLISALFLSCAQAPTTNETLPRLDFTPAAPVPSAAATSAHTIQLSWPVIQYATSYRVFRSMNPADQYTQIATTQGTLFIDSPLAANTPYYYKVTAVNADGESGFSSYTTATTQAPVLVPAPPTLFSPANGIANVSISAVLSWNSVTGAASYQLQVAQSSDFGSTAYSRNGLTVPSQGVSALGYSTTYYWRVNATNTAGTSDWSIVWSFVTQAHPVTPAGMTLINGGTFQMGQVGIAVPVHSVTVSSFYMDTIETTQQSYKTIMGSNPSRNDYKSAPFDPQLPVENVSWFDAVRFCNKRSIAEGLQPCYDTSSWTCDIGKNGYRLPTEAEWEYACRAGTATKYYWGDSHSGNPGDNFPCIIYYWSAGQIWPPSYAACKNPWGLYNMSGNVWEWCNDWYAAYSSGAATDPTGPSSGSTKAQRGGSTRSGSNNDYTDLTSAGRNSMAPSSSYNGSPVGFRCVRR